MALNGSKWSIEKRIAEAMTKNTAGGMSMNSSLLLACCFRKKGGASQTSGVPKFQGIRCPIKHDHILDALGVPTLGSAMIFFWQNFTATMALNLVAYAGMYSLLREWDKIKYSTQLV